jgi:hypothetical protein
MVKTLPDKWIRKAVYDVVNNITVGGETIFCYDTRLTGKPRDNYIILSTQSNEVDKRTKCSYDWQSSILIDIFTRYKLSGNTGSRLLADNIMDAVRGLTDTLTLDVASGLTIVTQAQSFPSDLVVETSNEIIYRKLMRIEFLIE